VSVPDWLRFSPRVTPSANVALIATGKPVLIDSGFGSPASAALTERFLAENGLRAADLTALAITHFHNDHAGGAAALRAQGVPVLLHETEAALIAAGAPEAFDAAFLPFAVESFTVDRALRDGDVIDAGVELHVIHVPCQTPGCVAYWEPVDRVLFSGDLLQAEDVGWVRYDGTPGALADTVAAVERLAALDPAIVVPGHGPLVTDVPRAVERTLARYAGWAADPARPARHAARRIALTSLVLQPSTEEQLTPQTWARALIDVSGPDAVTELVAGLEASGVVTRDQDGVLHATVPTE
jgi:glyoxylase-like metal-dependent hydrolase (beta-lactamase superfamily II)